MKPTNRQREIDEILYQVEACYPTEFDPAMLDIWQESLSAYDIDAIKNAFSIHIKRSGYLPLIKDIVAIIEGGAVSIEARAEEQWRQVMAAIRRHGHKRAPVFEDPITADLIARQFSWTYMCNIEEDQIKWELRRWVNAYRLAAETVQGTPMIEAPAKVTMLAAAALKSIFDSKI